MKVFLLVCLAAAVYAEPEAEADPLLLYGQQPLVAGLYNNWAAAKPYLYNNAYNPVVYAQNPVVYKQQPAVVYKQPVAYASVLPALQEATVHQTERLEGPGGSVAGKIAVAGQHTKYTLYKGLNRDKREAEADPALLLSSGVVPQYYSGVAPQVYSGVVPQAYSGVVPQYYNGLQYQTPYYSGVPTYTAATYTTHQGTYVNGHRVAKREAEAEADPALFYSRYNSVYNPVYANSAVYSPYAARPVVSSPYVYNAQPWASAYRQQWW